MLKKWPGSLPGFPGSSPRAATASCPHGDVPGDNASASQHAGVDLDATRPSARAAKVIHY